MESELLTVWFSKPVLGDDPASRAVFNSDRHQIAAASVRFRSSSFEALDASGKVVQSWPASLVRRVDWPVQVTMQIVATGSMTPLSASGALLSKLATPNAGKPWHEADDRRLRERHLSGHSVRAIAGEFGRTEGSITSRLVKLGLIDHTVDTDDHVETSIGDRGTDESSQESRKKESPMGSEIERDEICIHGIDSVTCVLCKNADRPGVYITSGGTRYHRHRDCPALLDGQDKVLHTGGTPEPIEVVRHGSAKLIGRDPCRTCRPD